MADKPPLPPLSWVADVPLVTNPVIMRMMGIVLVGAYLMIALIFIVMVGANGRWEQLPQILAAMLLAFGIVALLFLFVMLVFFGNRMRSQFLLDSTGVRAVIVDRRAEIGRVLALAAGTGSGDATLAGAGLVASANRAEFTPWTRVAGAEFDRRHRRILFKPSGWRPVGAIYTTAADYPTVAARVREELTARGLSADIRT